MHQGTPDPFCDVGGLGSPSECQLKRIRTKDVEDREDLVRDLAAPLDSVG